ncbi:MAG TPA: nitroreductase family protein [Candidatus Limnocylindrales bacterium]|jgi:nitroreductase
MDTWTAIRTKRVVREFADRPVAPEHLDRILHAGRKAASSKNQQRWDFVVVEDRERLRALSRVGRYAGQLAGAPAAIALVTPDPRGTERSLSLLFDLGMATANMMLAAWELGVGSCPITVYDADLVREILGYPPDRHCAFLLSLGYPADPSVLTAPPRAGGRKKLDEIVHRERW